MQNQTRCRTSGRTGFKPEMQERLHVRPVHRTCCFLNRTRIQAPNAANSKETQIHTESKSKNKQNNKITKLIPNPFTFRLGAQRSEKCLGYVALDGTAIVCNRNKMNYSRGSSQVRSRPAFPQKMYMTTITSS